MMQTPIKQQLNLVVLLPLLTTTTTTIEVKDKPQVTGIYITNSHLISLCLPSPSIFTSALSIDYVTIFTA
jgi:hypothetical protein